MDAECSQICEQAVPLLLHCITLPVGADVFWKQIECEFQNLDWRSRFTAGELKNCDLHRQLLVASIFNSLNFIAAVERVITITRFMDTHPLRNSQPLQTALANAFCYLISSLDDSHVAVAQRTGLYSGTIHDSAFMVFKYIMKTFDKEDYSHF